MTLERLRYGTRRRSGQFDSSKDRPKILTIKEPLAWPLVQTEKQFSAAVHGKSQARSSWKPTPRSRTPKQALAIVPPEVDDEGAARWNSNELFGIEKLVAQFKDQELIWVGDLDYPSRLQANLFDSEE